MPSVGPYDISLNEVDVEGMCGSPLGSSVEGYDLLLMESTCIGLHNSQTLEFFYLFIFRIDLCILNVCCFVNFIGVVMDRCSPTRCGRRENCNGCSGNGRVLYGVCCQPI